MAEKRQSARLCLALLGVIAFLRWLENHEHRAARHLVTQHDNTAAAIAAFVGTTTAAATTTGVGYTILTNSSDTTVTTTALPPRTG